MTVSNKSFKWSIACLLQNFSLDTPSCFIGFGKPLVAILFNMVVTRGKRKAVTEPENVEVKKVEKKVKKSIKKSTTTKKTTREEKTQKTETKVKSKATSANGRFSLRVDHCTS